MGTQFVAPAFITVVVGGATNIITGTLYSAGSLATIRTPIGMYLGSFAGTVGLFFAALILIRLYPNGLASIRLFGEGKWDHYSFSSENDLGKQKSSLIFFWLT